MICNNYSFKKQRKFEVIQAFFLMYHISKFNNSPKDFQKFLKFGTIIPETLPFCLLKFGVPAFAGLGATAL